MSVYNLLERVLFKCNGYIMDHEQTFRTSGKNLIKLAIPLIGTHLANVALGITDTVMMGWYSVTALAALVLGNAYFFVFFLFGAGFAFAVQPRCISLQFGRVKTRKTLHENGVVAIPNLRKFISTNIFQC